MNKYQEVTDLLFDLKESLNDKGCMDREVESILMLINRKIDVIRKNEHEDKQRIADLLNRL